MRSTKQHEALVWRVDGARKYLAQIEGKHPEFLVEAARASLAKAEADLATYVASRARPAPAPVRDPADDVEMTGLFAQALGGRMRHMVADASRLEPVTVHGDTYLSGRYKAVCGRSYGAMWTSTSARRGDVCPHCLAKAQA